MRTMFLALAVLATTAPAGLRAQARDSLVGTWRLVSASATTANGGRNDASFGPSPKGLLTYTSEGDMSVIISYGGRKPLSVADRLAAPAEERAQAFSTCFAYAGRYSLSSDKVIHHVEVSSVENWVNTDLVRLFRVEGDRLTLRTPPMSVGGRMQTTELIWERVK